MRVLCRFSGMFFAVAVMLSGLTAEARQLSFDEAVGRVVVSGRHKAPISGNASELNLVYTASRGDKNLYYIANKGDNQGFVILSADDCFYPLIAYANEGSFDSASVPETMRGVMSMCEANIASAMEEGTFVSDEPVSADRSTPIDNFVTARWDQRYPYYNMTPTKNGAQCLTGCVATAMAEVMYYYKYPVSGVGSHSYTWNNTNVSADFGAIEFKWDKMVDSYNFSSNSEACDAVAELMYACGVSVDMVYGTEASAANIYSVAAAMANYFGYDDSIRVENRRTYTSEQWHQMIYDELAAGRPVLYSGSDATAGGHYFVCCGCDGNDYYFINWGWGGSCNMYFKLDALNASGCKFNSQQSIVTHIMPDDGIDAGNGFNMVGMGSLKLYYKDFGKEYPRRNNSTEYLWPTSSDNLWGFYNFNWRGETPSMGVIFENVENDESHVVVAYDNNPSALGMMGRKLYYQIHHNDFPTEGTYRLYPAATDADGEWHKIPFDTSSPQYITVECSPTTFVFTISEEGLPKLVASATAPEAPQKLNVYFDIPVTIENVGTGAYNDDISIFYGRDVDGYVIQQKLSINVEPGETLKTSFRVRMTSPGKYTANIRDNANNFLVSNLSYIVKSNERPVSLAFGGSPQVEVNLDDSQATREVKVCVTTPVLCEQGYYFGPLDVFINDAVSNETVSYILGEDNYSIYEGKTVTARIAGTMPLMAGHFNVELHYTDDFNNWEWFNGHENYPEELSFYIDDAQVTGVEIVSAQSSARQTVVYTLGGVKVGDGDTSRLPAGLYIVVRDGVASKLIVK